MSARLSAIERVGWIRCCRVVAVAAKNEIDAQAAEQNIVIDLRFGEAPASAEA